MNPVDPGAALRDIADQLPGMRDEVTGLHEAVRKSRLWIAVAVIIAAAAVGWTAYQQTTLRHQQGVINSQQAVLKVKSAAIARLERQDAARAVSDARDARALCLRLRQSRAEILPVWKRVLSERRGDAVLLPRVEKAVPLGNCPEE